MHNYRAYGFFDNVREDAKCGRNGLVIDGLPRCRVNVDTLVGTGLPADVWGVYGILYVGPGIGKYQNSNKRTKV